jgi:aminoglycoside phosphotransferase (APT) family kinase protein
VPWFDGDVAADVPPDDAGDAAQRIGDLLATLHVEAPSDAPHNPYRGVAVSTLRGRFEERLPDVAAMIDVAAVARRWETVTEADVWTGPATWIHGDLHTANVLVRDGEIHAVIDWGDLAAGDPACDLAIGWMLFDDDDDRDRFRRAAGRHLAVDDATWLRAQAWGLYFAVMYLAHSADSPRFERMGRSLLGRLLVEPDGH